MPSVPIELGPVQETLLIPLLGRAVETGKTNGLLKDPRAVEILEQLDYDFEKWRGIQSLVGASLRTRLFDEEVEAFLAVHPEGTVVEIGAGLNTRYERLDNGRAHWLELDLPDSMALRRQFFADTERRRMVAASALDTDWLDEVAALPGPTCFVSEAVLIYLEGTEVEAVVRGLAGRFPGSWFLTDTSSTAMVDGQASHDAMRHLSPASWFRWKCDDPRSIQPWGLRLDRSRTFLDAPDALRRRLPLPFRLVARWAPFLIRRKLEGYRINRYTLVQQDVGPS